MSDVDPLNADSSPSVKQARRLNAVPMILLLLVVAVVAGIFGYAINKRSRPTIWESSRGGAGGDARSIAMDLTTRGGGVIAAPPPPAPPVVIREAAPEAPERQRPVQDDGRQDRLRLLQRRIRLAELAADADPGLRLDGDGLQRQRAGAATGREAIMAEIQRTEAQLAALRSQGADTRAYEARLADLRSAVAAADSGTSIPVEYGGRSDLSRVRQFEGRGGSDRWKNPGRVEPPETLLTLRTGSVIPAVLISGINSDLPGQIIGQVSQDVYDTPTGRYLLIPQGSRLVGEYSSQVQYGQSRVFAVWQRLIFPDGKALDLGAMTAATGDGYAGLKDRVNNHYLRIFGSALMMSAILAGVQMTQQGGSDGDQQRMSDALSESLGVVFGGAIAEMLQKNMSIAPTLEVRPGFRLNVMMLRDLVFATTYQGFDYAVRAPEARRDVIAGVAVK